MKKEYSILLLIIGSILLITSCKGGDEFVLEGTLNTPKGEKIIVVYDDPITKIDSIFPKEGQFEYAFVPDTITLMRLVDSEGNSLPIFADKGWKVTCKGSFTKPYIEGDGPNAELQEFRNSIEDIKGDAQKVLQKANDFISSHPLSFASAYILNQYYIQKYNPDIDHIEKLITPLDGKVKDSRILNVAIKSMKDKDGQNNEILNYYSLKDRNDKYLSWGLSYKEFILVNFWASWDEKSKEAAQLLRGELMDKSNIKVKVFNVSLDYDKKQWLNNCLSDQDYWIEICDLKGWEAPIVKNNNILSLPSNILIDSQRRILGRDLDSKTLIKIIEEKSE